jgi:hypothetical protein
VITLRTAQPLKLHGALCWLACCFFVGTHAIAGESGDAELLKKLSAAWSDQRSAVQSAEIEYRCVERDAQPKRKQLDVATLVLPGNWVTNEPALGNLIPALDGSLQGAKELWGVQRFVTDGNDFREDSASVPITSSHVYTGAYEVYSRTVTPPNGNQIDLYVRGKSHMRMRSIADFNRIPSERFSELSAVDRRAQTDPGRVLIKAGREAALVDEDTGFLFEYRAGAVDDPRYQEVYQFGPAKHDHVLLPTAIFSGDYRSGALEKFTILIIDSATLNQTVDPDWFIVSGKKNDILVNYGNGGKTVTQLDWQVADVLNQ